MRPWTLADCLVWTFKLPMNEPTPLDSLFKEKIFRVPDYQRGYAWQREQLKAFWEDLVNLSDGRSHYTGVLTLAEIPRVAETEKEFWLVDDHSYRVYHVVDGQQRLTTFVIFIQALVDFVKSLPENHATPDKDIYLADTQSVAGLQERFLFKQKPTGDQFRTYKFGYTEDNPSYDYLRHRILDEPGGGSVQETFYTLNLSNAKRYFGEQLSEMHAQEGVGGIQNIYKKLTKRFLFNEYIIKDEFDVFVAFETMNNRGKKLSDLELLKNRLIYLTTLYSDAELDAASRQNLRETINDAWKEVYKQLGRNKHAPLNDDDFLRAHWILYYKYSRKTGQDYIRYLLEEQFTPQRVHKKVEREVMLEAPEESRDEAEFEEEPDAEAESETVTVTHPDLAPTEIRDYVLSLKACAVHWFNSFFPALAPELTAEEQRWVDALNRIGIAYFRPLVMAILKSDHAPLARVEALRAIERFIFIVFRMNKEPANYGSSEFYRMVRTFDQGELGIVDVLAKLDSHMAYTFDETTDYFNRTSFFARSEKRFKDGGGYYWWPALRYFLFEYELSLLAGSRQTKVSWDDLKKSERDMISIEHIFPQTPTPNWEAAFSSVPSDRWVNYQGTLGNLLVLSHSINASLQNDDFADKKRPKHDATGNKIRNGYADGSHSEIEVAANANWGPTEVRERGLKLMQFLESRWRIRLGSERERLKLLFLLFDEQDATASSATSSESAKVESPQPSRV
jgi:uncharacterized protein DUF262/uncharacterized protein DUF1524